MHIFLEVWYVMQDKFPQGFSFEFLFVFLRYLERWSSRMHTKSASAKKSDPRVGKYDKSI